MRKAILVLLVVSFALPALASQPGHPLDCSDWTILTPGVHCSVSTPLGAPISSEWPTKGPTLVLDNEGWRYRVKSVGPYSPYRGSGYVEIYRFRDQYEELVARVEDRIGPAGYTDRIRGSEGETLLFDPISGRLYVGLVDDCMDPGPGYPSCTFYNPGRWIAALDGFTPLFEILQTYTPTADALQFRVPAHPEGLRSADHFDIYWGHVSDLPDFTQAQPMVCNYPATPPAADDYMTVADTSPAPPPGSANYTVTAVTYGAQRRYGRKLINSVMSGRDPALLPACP